MKINSLKTQIVFSFLIVIIIFALLVLGLGNYLLENDIIKRAQKEVFNALGSARTVYQNELETIKTALILSDDKDNEYLIKDVFSLDYIYRIRKDNRESEIVTRAFNGIATGGTRIIAGDYAKILLNNADIDFSIDIKDTPKARPLNTKTLTDVLVLECAIPVIGNDGEVSYVKYAGKIINKDYALVDKIKNLIFEKDLYNNKPLGTVTIFQDDVRVSTNVLNKNNERAIGTRVSEIVYKKVIGDGSMWKDRAFVVTDWYITAYEPIRNIFGKPIGILYVGILEKPFTDLKRNIFVIFSVIIFLTGILAFFVSYFLAYAITKPVDGIINATDKIADGDFLYKIDNKYNTDEFNSLKNSFDKMAEKLNERETSLKKSKEQVEASNKKYLDLVGFVSHELKGILSSIVLNTYSLINGFMGNINEPQKKALNSMAKNLDYLTATVKNFLNLSRIEKEELELNLKNVLIKEDIFDISIEAFEEQAKEKAMTIINEIEPGVKIKADTDLMQIVANNLMSNAIKYGKDKGIIKISSKLKDTQVEIEVYNDGKPIADIDIDKLFKKFSRVQYEGMQKVKGTGIGLFITKEIIGRHGGVIYIKPQEHGNSFIFNVKKI